jgi:hypothetical protein
MNFVSYINKKSTNYIVVDYKLFVKDKGHSLNGPILRSIVRDIVQTMTYVHERKIILIVKSL